MEETIPAVFTHQASVLPDKILFLVKRGDSYQPMTRQQAFEDVVNLSTFLLAQQVNAGDRVLIISENRPEWGLADLAIQSVGAWAVPIYPSLSEQAIRMICNDCQPVAAVTSSSDQANVLLQINRSVPSLRLIVVVDATQQHPTLVMPWAEALAKGREMGSRLRDFLDHRRSRIGPDDTATLLYTSGTTGEPKGVMLSHRNLLSNVEACLQVIPIAASDVALSFLPLSHIFERMAGWYLMLSIGATVAYAESMDTVAQNMLEVHPTVMLGVPRFFEKLYLRIQEALHQASPGKRWVAEWALRVGQAITARLAAGQSVPLWLQCERWMADRLVFQKLKARLGGRLRFFVSGGAPLSKEIAEFFYSVGVTILEGYGLTETAPVIAVNRFPIPRFGSVGQVIPGVDVRIADDGEILTRGPNVMQGYYNKPEATAAAVVDGWFHTGDIGHVDSQRNLVITDRKKDLIKTAGGKFVAPQKLENLLVTDPYITQAFVYGGRRPYCVALIVPCVERLHRYAQEQEIPARSLQELVRDERVRQFYWNRVQEKQQGLSSFEQVKKIALLEQEFSQAAGELTPTLKAKRRVIAQRHDALLQNLYQTSPA
ncbi:MAG: long-chain fatty acid--CoA ligase [Candidatus Omnitrophica bacterium]|nr:long-chain fatty acid--CoA ligase [Candidatus Omnitrophota bacterium]